MTEDEDKVIKEEQVITKPAKKSATTATESASSPSDQPSEAKPEKKELSSPSTLFPPAW